MVSGLEHTLASRVILNCHQTFLSTLKDELRLNFSVSLLKYQTTLCLQFLFLFLHVSFLIIVEMRSGLSV